VEGRKRKQIDLFLRNSGRPLQIAIGGNEAVFLVKGGTGSNLSIQISEVITGGRQILDSNATQVFKWALEFPGTNQSEGLVGLDIGRAL
jgi:hypothetical protein